MHRQGYLSFQSQSLKVLAKKIIKSRTNVRRLRGETARDLKIWIPSAMTCIPTLLSSRGRQPAIV